MMTMLRAPTAIKQGAERSRSDGLDGVERGFFDRVAGGHFAHVRHTSHPGTATNQAMPYMAMASRRVQLALRMCAW